MNEPTKPLPFRDIAGPAIRVRETTPQPPSQFFIPRSDAELEKVLAEIQDPNLIAAVTKEYLKAKGVLDASHPFGELGTTVNRHIRPTPGIQRTPANETKSLPSEEMVRLCETETDPSVLQYRLSHQLHNEPIFEVRHQAPPPKPLYDPNQNFFQKCYPHGNDEVLVSADSKDALDEAVDKLYGQYGKVRGVDFH